MENKRADERILILAPTGRDGSLIAETLTRVGYDCARVKTLSGLCRELELGAGVIGIEEESLTDSGFAQLKTVIQEQAPWSDLPFIVLTQRGRSASVSYRQQDLRGLRN